MQAAKALASLGLCTDLAESLLLPDAISTEILSTGPYKLCAHGWKFKNSKILNFQNSNLKTCIMPTSYFTISSLNGQLSFDRLNLNQKTYL